MKILKDNIFVWEGALSDQFCEEVCEITDRKIHIAEVVGNATPNEPDSVLGVDFRDNKKRTDVSLTLERFGSLSEHRETLLRKLEECIREMSGSYEQCGCPLIEQCEPVVCKVQRTPPGGGFSQWHFEQGGTRETARRWGVWMLYLNDVNKGGKTDFPNQDLSVTPKKGTMVIWPAAYTHPHRSAPDLEEWKYIVTGWLVYPETNESRRGTSRI